MRPSTIRRVFFTVATIIIGTLSLSRLKMIEYQGYLINPIDAPSIIVNEPKVGLCVMLKDSKPYIQEWVDYNKAIGFYEIYIYDNSDSFELKNWWLNTRNRTGSGGVFSVTHVPGLRKKQLEANKDCLTNFGKRVDYLAFFDDDEFLVMNQHSSVGEYVNEYMSQGYGQIATHWLVFGSSNHSTYEPNIPVLKRFQWRTNDKGLRKPIIRVEDGLAPHNPHSFILKNNASTVSIPIDVAALYHFKYKSEDEYRYKSCVRKTTNNVIKDCGVIPPAGDVFDDKAWKILIDRVPKYRERFDSLLSSSSSSSNMSNSTSDLEKSSFNLSRITNDINATIIIQVSGGLGNILSYIAYAYSVHLRAKEEYGLHTNLVLKATWGWNRRTSKAKDELLQCWPQFRSWNILSDDNSSEFVSRWNDQESWMDVNWTKLGMINSDGNKWRDSINHLQQLVKHPNKVKYFNTSSSSSSSLDSNTGIMIPFLPIQKMGFPSSLNIQKEFQIGLFKFHELETGCCRNKPFPDETVYHYRNFETELATTNVDMNRFKDLSPKRIVNELLNHLNPGDKIAIVSRLKVNNDNENVYELIKLLKEEKQLQVRLMTNHTAMEDLCFIKNTKKEFIGFAKSTYFKIASKMINNINIVPIKCYYTTVISSTTYRKKNETKQILLRQKPKTTTINGYPCEEYTV